MVRPRQIQHPASPARRTFAGPLTLRPLAPGGGAIWRARRSLTPSRGPQRRLTSIRRAQPAPTLHNIAHFTEPTLQSPPRVLRRMGSFGLTGLLPAVGADAHAAPAGTQLPSAPSAVYDRAVAPAAQAQAAPKAVSQRGVAPVSAPQGVPVPQQFPSAGIYGSSGQSTAGAPPASSGVGYSSRAY
jgi:hypothetical protein